MIQSNIIESRNNNLCTENQAKTRKCIALKHAIYNYFNPSVLAFTKYIYTYIYKSYNWYFIFFTFSTSCPVYKTYLTV